MAARAGVFLLGATALLTFRFQERLGRRLPDGSRRRVLGVVRGANTALEVPRSYTRPPITWLPWAVRQRLGLLPSGLSTGALDPNPNAVFVWYVRYDSQRQEYRPHLFSRVEVLDDEGRLLGEAAQTPLDSPVGRAESSGCHSRRQVASLSGCGFTGVNRAGSWGRFGFLPRRLLHPTKQLT